MTLKLTVSYYLTQGQTDQVKSWLVSGSLCFKKLVVFIQGESQCYGSKEMYFG